MLTFQSKKLHEVGCGIYLLTSSIMSLITVTVLFLKYWILYTTQTGLITNRLFLWITCVSIDAIVQGFLTVVDWLHACVAIERAIMVTYSIHFNKTKSKQAVKWIILILFIFITISYIKDPIHSRLIDDLEEDRTWCIVSYSYVFQTINSAMNIIHVVIPFSMNIISASAIVIAVTRARSTAQGQKSFKDHFMDQINQYMHLFVSPIILIVLTIPRLIIALITDCMKSTRDPWLFLAGYFISFTPTLLTFLVFVLPSKTYRSEFVEIFKKLQFLKRVRIL
ncbi:unnamed protein product [Adineta steineri]|nr:unnamed protein product [Adineta steineri]